MHAGSSPVCSMGPRGYLFAHRMWFMTDLRFEDVVRSHALCFFAPPKVLERPPKTLLGPLKTPPSHARSRPAEFAQQADVENKRGAPSHGGEPGRRMERRPSVLWPRGIEGASHGAILDFSPSHVGLSPNHGGLQRRPPIALAMRH